MTQISATSATAPQASASAAQLQVDYENFLTLLTAQISNQDPLAPMESTEFVSQLAQLTQVEQSIQTNANLESISAAMAVNSAKIDLGLLGHQVVVPGDVLDPASGRFFYTLAEDAAQVGIVVRDAAGQVVRRLDAPSAAGGQRIEVAWDGLDTSGSPVAQGTYRVAVGAVSASGDAVEVETAVETAVTAVGFDSGSTVMTLGNGQGGSPAEVLEVR